MTQGQFLSGLWQVWIQSFPFPRLVASQRLKSLVCVLLMIAVSTCYLASSIHNLHAVHPIPGKQARYLASRWVEKRLHCLRVPLKWRRIPLLRCSSPFSVYASPLLLVRGFWEFLLLLNFFSIHFRDTQAWNCFWTEPKRERVRKVASSPPFCNLTLESQRITKNKRHNFYCLRY